MCCHCLLTAYESLLIPLVCYGIIIWGAGYKTSVKRAQIIQNDVFRAVFNVKRYESVSEMYEKFGLLRIDQLYTPGVAQLAFKTIRGIIPQDIAFPMSQVPKRSERRPTAFEHPRSNKESSRQAISYRVPAVWASLLREIRSLQSAKRFIQQ